MLESAEEHLEADNGLQHDAVMNEKKKHSQNLQEKNRLMRILEKFSNDNPLQKAQIRLEKYEQSIKNLKQFQDGDTSVVLPIVGLESARNPYH